MSGVHGCNQRAVIYPMFLFSILAWLVVPAGAAVFFTDDANGSGDQRFGAACSEVGDVNADGAGEFLIGAPGDNTTGILAGAAFFRYGGEALTVAADQRWLGQAAYDQFGWSVSRIGDVNNDGKDDWAIGAPATTNSNSVPGKVYVYYGELALTQSPLVITGEAADDRFGFSIAAAGDFDGDGVDDFVVGAPYNNALGVDQGAAYVIFGSNAGPSSDLGDALKLTGGLAGDHFGWSVIGAGSFLGGNAAVAAGAPQADSAMGMESGTVYVFAGGAGYDATVDETINTGAVRAYAWYGYSLANAGRWNGDSYDDLAIGAPNNVVSTNNTGRVDIVFGGSSVSNTGDRTVYGESAADQFGYGLDRLGALGDFQDDDLVIGAPLNDLSGADSGRAYLYPAGSSSLGTASSLALPVTIMVPARSDQAGDQIGWAVSSAGDFDGDGEWDYAVGAPGGNILDGTAAGTCRLVDAAGLVVAGGLQWWDAWWNGPDEVALGFGFAVSPEQIAEVTLVREDLDESGAVTARSELWRGRPLPQGRATDPHDGDCLYLADREFRYIDDEPATGAAAMRYDLTATTFDGDELQFVALAGPGPAPAPIAAAAELGAVWPNPFNPTAQVKYRAPPGQEISVRIVDVRGRVVRTLFSGTGTGAWQTSTWNGADESGRSLASGVYLVHLDSPEGRATRRVVLAK